MKILKTRIAVSFALAGLLVACGGGTQSEKPFSQEDYTKSLASYMNAAGTNFQGFSADTALPGTSDCTVDNAGKDGATAECKVDTFDSQDDAMKAYTTQKDRLTKGLPADARGGEQKNAAPNTPLRFAAVSGKGGAILILTKNGDKFVVGYVFEKAPG